MNKPRFLSVDEILERLEACDLDQLFAELVVEALQEMTKKRWRMEHVGCGPQQAVYAGKSAEDAVQETFEKILDGRFRWDVSRHPDTREFLKYRLRGHISNWASSAENKQLRNVADTEECESDAFESADTSPSPRSYAETNEITEKILALLENAGDEEVYCIAECILEHGIEKPVELARELGMSVEEVRAARKRMARKLASVCSELVE